MPTPYSSRYRTLTTPIHALCLSDLNPTVRPSRSESFIRGLSRPLLIPAVRWPHRVTQVVRSERYTADLLSVGPDAAAEEVVGEPYRIARECW